MEPLLGRYRILRLIAAMAFLLAAYGPLLAVLAGAASAPAPDLASVLSPRRLELLARSLAFSLAVAAFAGLLGLLAAIAILRHSTVLAGQLQWLLLASIALPPTVPAMAWAQILAIAWPTSIGSQDHWLQAGLAQAMALLPFACGIALAALRSADPLLLDAARLHVTPVRMLFGVAIPLARSTLMAGAALVFLLSLLDYTIPSIFSANVYALEIFVAFSASHSVADALWLSLPLIVCALLLVLPLAGLPHRLGQTANRDLAIDGDLPVWLHALLLIGAATCLVAATAPLLAVVPSLADPAYLGRTLAASVRETVYTLQTSTLAAILALLLAIVPALQLARGGRAAGPLWVIALLPFLLPPALTGIGLIALWSPVRFVDIYGSPWLTVAAELARFTPVAVIVLTTWLVRMDATLIDAALVNGRRLRSMLTNVLLPLAAPGLTAALGICFALSLGEIGANLLVTPAGAATLTMKTYNYLHYGGSPAAAGLCLLLTILAALGAALPAAVLTMGRHWRR